MSQEVERVYTINLGKVWLSPNNQRAKRAINMIKEFATHHMKTEQIKIDQELSQAVWKRGIRSPPRKIRVKMTKTDDGYVLVSLYEEEKQEPKSEKVEERPKEKQTPKPEVEQKAQQEIKEEKTAKEKPKKQTKGPKKQVKKEPKKESK